MPRCFFHIMNGQVIIDDVGVELPDIDAVRKEAIPASGATVSGDKQAWKGESWQMTGADEVPSAAFYREYNRFGRKEPIAGNA